MCARRWHRFIPWLLVGYRSVLICVYPQRERIKQQQKAAQAEEQEQRRRMELAAAKERLAARAQRTASTDTLGDDPSSGVSRSGRSMSVSRRTVSTMGGRPPSPQSRPTTAELQALVERVRCVL